MKYFGVVSVFLLSLSACNHSDSIDSQLGSIIEANSLTGDPMLGRDIPDINSKKAQLGMRLFFSKSLGGDSDSACASCHHPMLGGSDRLSLPIGVGAVDPDLLGPGRLHLFGQPGYDDGPTVPRNSPTTFNVAGWDSVIFHDGRVESLGKTVKANGDDGQGIRTPDSLSFDQADPFAGSTLVQAQARFPVTSREEMKGFNHDDKNNKQIRDYLAARIGGHSGIDELGNTAYWLSQFQNVYGPGAADVLVTEQNISELIAVYERSQSFVNTPWRSYVEGKTNALTAEAKKGALLFFRPVEDGGAGCASCHSGDFFTDEQFHNIAMPQLGRGKGNGTNNCSDGSNGCDDFGRFRETGKAEDKYAFRTPGLINVEVTGPWGHAGAYTTLENVVRHHLNPQQAVDNYDFGQLDQPGIQNQDKMLTNTQKALDLLKASRAAGKSKLKNRVLTDTQVNQLLAFLKALTDPCVKDRACMAAWIPPVDDDPNGFQLDATDGSGTSL